MVNHKSELKLWSRYSGADGESCGGGMRGAQSGKIENRESGLVAVEWEKEDDMASVNKHEIANFTNNEVAEVATLNVCRWYGC